MGTTVAQGWWVPTLIFFGLSIFVAAAMAGTGIKSIEEHEND
ncbi:MAG: hypothetical protein ACE5EH_02165 [Gammaproteobacteria bacterium]